MISVIIPVYNAAPYLVNTLNSVINQTYKDLEILLIDDGSVDGSAKICEEYKKIDKRIRVFHIKNLGVSNARNLGIQKSIGEYIAFIDDDDYITPTYIERLFDALIQTGCKASMCYYEKINEEDSLSIKEIKKDGMFIDTMNSERMFEAIMAVPIDKIRKEPIPYEFIWAKLYDRNLLEGLYFRSGYGEDIEFNSRLYIKKFNFAVVHSTNYFWIQRPRSLHILRNSEGFENHLGLFLTIIENLPYDKVYFRGLGLKKLMLAATASQYAIKRFSFNSNSIEKVKHLLNMIKEYYFKEFLKNHSIPLLFKILISFYIVIPQSYSFSRFLMEKISKYK